MAIELPVFFQFPGNSLLNQILINENTGYSINKDNFKNLSKEQINNMVIEMPEGFWDDKRYIKNVVRGHQTFPVVLPMPFSKISGLTLIERGGRTYFLVSVDWTNRENSDKMNTENQRITYALINQHGYDADFPPEDKGKNDQILRDAGLLGGGKSKNKKSYKKSKKNKSKKKNKRRGF